MVKKDIMYKSKKYKEFKETVSKTDVYDKRFLEPFEAWIDGYEHAMSQLKFLNLHDVMASAFVVWVNRKCIVVIAKTKEEVMDRLRGAGIEWDLIRAEPLDAIFPHLP